MKKAILILALSLISHYGIAQKRCFVVPNLTCTCNVNEWISQDIGDFVQYSTWTTNKSGNSAYLHVFFWKEVGHISEAWIYTPEFVVDHQDLPRFTVYLPTAYTLNGKRVSEETGARNWSCTVVTEFLEEIYGKEALGITVIDGALGGGNFLDMIRKTDVSVTIPSRTSNRTVTFKRMPYQINCSYNN